MIESALAVANCSALRAGRALEHAVRQVRSYFLPSHIRTYLEMLRRPAPASISPSQKIACFDFTQVDIDHVSGRYVFALVREFEALGLLTCYRRNFRFLATMRHKEHKRLLLDRPFQLCRSIAELPGEALGVEITDRDPASAGSSHPRIQIRYEKTWPRNDREFPMRFFVHPLVYDRWITSPPPDLDAPREWRVFFGGRSQDREYRVGVLPERFGKMSRWEIMETLSRNLPASRFRRVQGADDLARGVFPQGALIWADSATFRLPSDDWLSTLERADFFLACPGMDMPLCHNLVESMSRAAIPILEHPEYLDPPLQHNVNCLVFNGPESLLAVLKLALDMDPDNIRRLRRNVDAYYRDRLAPGRFAERLMQSQLPGCTILMNACRTPKFRGHQ